MSDASDPSRQARGLLSFVYSSLFVSDWRRLGLGEGDLEHLERLILERPDAGAVMSGTGGLRKIRFAPAGGGRGKSGSERVCYALFPEPGVVFMVAAFGKNERANLTAAERNEVRAILTTFARKLEERNAK